MILKENWKAYDWVVVYWWLNPERRLIWRNALTLLVWRHRRMISGLTMTVRQAMKKGRVLKKKLKTFNLCSFVLNNFFSVLALEMDIKFFWKQIWVNHLFIFCCQCIWNSVLIHHCKRKTFGMKIWMSFLT